MTIKELKQKNINELQSLLAQERSLGQNLRFKNANQQLKTVRQIRQAKKNIARILTLLNQTTREQNEQATPGKV